MRQLPNRLNILILALVLFSASISFATTGITYQGRILKPDGTPLAGQFTKFKLELHTPDAQSCLMYQETQTLDLRTTSGSFNLTLADGTVSRSDSSGYSLEQIFANRGSFTFNPAQCASGTGVWGPAPDDGRKLVVLFQDETMSGWEAIPDIKLSSAPFAYESKQVQGFGADSLLRVANGTSDPIGSIPALNNTEYLALKALAGGSSLAYTKTGYLAGVALPTMGTNQVLGWDGANWVSTTAVAGPNSVSSTMIQAGAVSTTQIASNVTINTTGSITSASSVTQDFQLKAAAPSTFAIDMTAPATLPASYSLIWPANAGANGQVLTTNGTGTLSWLPSGASQWTTHGSNISYDTVGNVGIGTTTPGTSTYGYNGAKLQIYNSAANSVALLQADSANSMYNGEVYSNSAHAFLVRGYRFGGTSTAPTSVSSGTPLMSIQSLAYDGTASRTMATMTSTVDMVTGTNDLSSYLAFSTRPDGVGASATERLRIDKNGNVGIGTTSPGALLDVNGQGKFNSLSVGTSSLYGSTVAIVGSQAIAAPNAAPTLSFFRNGSADVAGDIVGALAFAGYDGSANQSSAKIYGVVTSGSTVAAGSVPTDISFNTGSNPGTLAERLRITSGGNVGIGTTSPGSLLSLGGTGQLMAVGDGSNQAAYMNLDLNRGFMGFGSTGGGTNNVFLQASGTTKGLEFIVNGGAFNTGTTAMYIPASGNVGIGTTSPAAKLHLAAGTNSLAPLKLTSSGAAVLLTTPQDGAVEYDGTGLWFTIGTQRYVISTTTGGAYNNVTNISNSSGSIVMAPIAGSGSVQINSGTSSLSSTTGALIVTGGAGISQNLNVGANIVAGGSMSSSSIYSPQIYGSSTTGASIKIDGNDTATNGNVLLASTSGNVGIGTTSPTSTLHVQSNATATGGSYYQGFQVYQTVNPATSNTGDVYYGGLLRATAATSNSTGDSLVGAENSSHVYAGSGAINNATGTSGQMLNQAARTVTNGFGGQFVVSTNNASSVITNAYGVMAQIDSPTGTISKGYGLYIGNIAATTPFAVFTSGTTPSYFGGNVGIGTTSPSSLLEAQGAGATASTEYLVGKFDSNNGQKGVGLGYFENATGTAPLEGRVRAMGAIPLVLGTSNSPRAIYIDDLTGRIGVGTTAPLTTIHASAAGGVAANSGTASNALLRLAPTTSGLSLDEGLAGGANAHGWLQVTSPADLSLTGSLVLNPNGGNVGIGTTSPSSNLSFSGQAAQTIGLERQLTAATAGQDLTIKAGSAVSGGTDVAGGSLNLVAGTATGNNGSAITFQTSTNGSGSGITDVAPTVKMKIFPNGLTALGSVIPSGPTGMLHVAGINSNAYTGNFYRPNNTVGNVNSILFSLQNANPSEVTYGQIDTGISANTIGSHAGYMAFSTAKAGTVTEQMRIDTNGKVGIGTTSPSAKLTVAGGDVVTTTTGSSKFWTGYGGNYLYMQEGNPAQIVSFKGLTFNANSINAMAIDLAGNVGIGTTSPGYKLDVSGDLRITGTPWRDGGDIAWQVSSDSRLKDVTGDYERGLREIVNLKTITFRYKEGNAKHLASDKEYTGVIAQEAQKQFPEAVQTDKDGYLSLNTTPIFWAMINAIKDLYAKHLDQSQELEQLRSQIEKQNALIKLEMERIDKLERAPASVKGCKPAPSH